MVEQLNYMNQELIRQKVFRIQLSDTPGAGTHTYNVAWWFDH